jgi:hypothetical protein
MAIAIVNEQSTIAVTAAFKDESGGSVTPTAVTWTLTDGDKQIVNERDAVPVAAASVVTIVLSGDDLAIGTNRRRYLTIEATYDSDLGTGLPLKDELSLNITDLAGVS